jgi:hypothetical protein
VGVLNALSITGVLLAAAFFLCRATAPISRPACGADIRSHRD